MTKRTIAGLAYAAMLLVSLHANAHDASTYGGMFRSRDQGQSWFSIDTGVFIGGALGLAVHPVERNHLLMATDAGLLRSGNGGRDWHREAPAQFDGPVFAVAFDATGQHAWAATTHQVLRLDASNIWRVAHAPSEAAPAQVISAARAPGAAYLVGMDGFFVSRDAGQHWSRAGTNLPEGEIAAFARVMRDQHELLFLIVNAALWMSADGAQTWRAHGSGLPAGKLDMIFARPNASPQMHAFAQGQLYASADFGSTWRAKGLPLAETHLAVRALAVSADGNIVLLTTHKGLYRSEDGGESWVLKEGNLPVHLEAGPLAIDPHDANTYYAGYALTPYGETWRHAAEARAQRAPERPGLPLIWIAVPGSIAVLLWLLWYGKRSRAAQR